MDWDKTMELYYEYLATHLSDGKKTAIEKAESRKNDVIYLLSQMSSLKKRRIEEITPEIWMEALQTYRKSDGYHRSWQDLLNWKKYKDFRACFIFARNNYTCQYCGKEETIDTNFNVDHIIPVSKGGGDDLNNLQCACDMCNRAKLHMSAEEYKNWIDDMKYK